MKNILTWKAFNEEFFMNSYDEINLGPCPKGEESIQVHVEQDYPRDPEFVDDNEQEETEEVIPTTDPNYLESQKEQCDKYVELLETKFAVCNKVTIFAKHFGYEGSGGYYEAVVTYNDNDIEQKCQANFISENLPSTWAETNIISAQEYQQWYEENKEFYEDDHEFNM